MAEKGHPRAKDKSLYGSNVFQELLSYFSESGPKAADVVAFTKEQAFDLGHMVLS